MAKASRSTSNFGSDAEVRFPYIPAKEKKMHLQSSTLCRYYATGSCRRASACRFVHLQPENVPQGMMSLCLLRLPRTYIAEISPSENAYSNEQPVHTRICRYYAAGHCRRGSACHFVHSLPESAPQGIPPLVYAYPNRHEVHTRTPLKGWDQDIGHSHGYTAYAIYTVAPHTEPYRFDTRGAFDNFSDVSSNSSPSDQSLNAAFQVITIEEPVPSEYLPSAFSQSSPSLQYPNNAGPRCGNVAYPGYDRGYTLTGLKPRTATRRKAEQAKEKQTLYRTKPCKFFSAHKSCPKGNKCRFFHDVEKSKRAKKADNQARETPSSHLPPKLHSPQEEFKAHDYYPITWRVIGGGVMMGGYRIPCKAFAAGYCPNGNNCKQAHETEAWTSENDIVELKTQTSATSVAVPSSAKQSIDSSVESKCRAVCTHYSDSSHNIHDTDGGTSGSTNDAEESMAASNSNSAVPSRHRRTRSMSMPTSPSVLRAPHIFAEL